MVTGAFVMAGPMTPDEVMQKFEAAFDELIGDIHKFEDELARLPDGPAIVDYRRRLAR